MLEVNSTAEYVGDKVYAAETTNSKSILVGRARCIVDLAQSTQAIKSTDISLRNLLQVTMLGADATEYVSCAEMPTGQVICST